MILSSLPWLRALLQGSFAVVVIAPHGAAGSIEEVLVTARKNSERPQDLPLSIRVLDEADLAPARVDTLQALSSRTPGLSFDSAWGGALARLVIRGQQQPTLAGDNVGLFVDGVYQANIDIRDVEPLDIERIEVVRGPQGTLFGHSTFAGAVHYVAARPTEHAAGGVDLDGGSNRLVGARGWLSGPLGDHLRGRIAVAARRADGTLRNAAPGGGTLGDSRRDAVAVTLASSPIHDWSAALSARYTHIDTRTPAFGSLDYREFNCGALAPSPAAWSYYCGKAPETPTLDLSTDLRDSGGNAGQIALRLSIPLGGLWLDAENSWYRARFTGLRDVDGNSAGDTFGVCSADVNCTGPAGSPRPVNRLVQLNIQDTFTSRSEEFSTEWRLHNGDDSAWRWMVGATGFTTREDFLAYSAVPRSQLAANERLAEWQPAAPFELGPLAALNAALVDDPDRQQVPRSGERRRRLTFAAFGSVERSVAAHLTFRGELRSSHEKLELKSIYDNYRPGFGNAIDPVEFRESLPRASLTLHASDALTFYVSAARGARAGGINANLGLIEAEQYYEPEFNWTHEIGLHYRGSRLQALDLSAFHIDWTDTQIRGFARSVGVNGQVIANTAGIRTEGIEAYLRLALAPSATLELSGSLIDAEFRHGSESPGDLTACGIAAQNTVSSFCTIGPTRHDESGRLVPWIDGNRPARVPTAPWHAGLTLEPPAVLPGWENWIRLDLAHQGNRYDSTVGGLKWGERTLLDARIGLRRGGWSIEFWGSNLTDDRYIRSTVSSFPLYYRAQPRPVDLFPGERRRIGATLSRTFD